jgi:predicted DNA-binding protein
VLHFGQMGNTITVRLPEDLAGWLEAASRKAGVPRGRIIREQLELARRREEQPFLHLAGSVEGARDLSTRKGFAKR